MGIKGLSITAVTVALVGGGVALGATLVSSGLNTAPRPVTVQQVADTSSSAPAPVASGARVNAPAVESATAVTTPPATSEAPVTPPIADPTSIAHAPVGSGVNPPPTKLRGPQDPAPGTTMYLSGENQPGIAGPPPVPAPTK
jgi:hypothetical protein